tara:strand:- start:4033 stop:4179 length:147 start_codon:yes stop_codon:yes gene_type:complete
MIKFCIPLLPIRLALSPSSVVDKDNVQLELIELFNEISTSGHRIRPGI